MSDAATDAARTQDAEKDIKKFLFKKLNDISYMASYTEILECYNDIINFKPIKRYFYFTCKNKKIDIIDYITKISHLESSLRRFRIGGLIINYFLFK